MTQHLALLTADRDLADAIPEEDLELAERLVVSEAFAVAAGPWRPDAHAGRGLLLLDGVVTREVRLADRRCTHLHGHGDVLRATPPDEGLLPAVVSWVVTQPAIVAVLDERFDLACRRWPALAATIQARLLAQADRLAVHAAIAQLPKVELRLLAVLWHLAERWGHITPEGVTIPLRLTHEALGRLVGARRPTVTLALAELAESGAVTRSSEGWLLQESSRAVLAPAPAAG
jgi:CRP/FNR family cyclic AMP-dependent transcriptional regulator